MKVILTGWIEAEGQLQSWHPSIKEEKRKKRKRKKGGRKKEKGKLKQTNKNKNRKKEAGKRPFLALASQRVNVQDGACWVEHLDGT